MAFACLIFGRVTLSLNTIQQLANFGTILRVRNCWLDQNHMTNDPISMLMNAAVPWSGEMARVRWVNWVKTQWWPFPVKKRINSELFIGRKAALYNGETQIWVWPIWVISDLSIADWREDLVYHAQECLTNKGVGMKDQVST